VVMNTTVGSSSRESLQDVHAGPPNWSVSFSGWKESHGCTGNGLLIGLA
jgi:hypothetical protein